MPTARDPFHPADDGARRAARALLTGARHGALAVLTPGTGAPGISRVALAPGPDGGPLTLVSSLAPHHAALAADPRAALMVGEPGPKGDPLAHPRLMIEVTARPVPRADPGHAALRAAFLAHQPKAALYIDFADFGLMRLEPVAAVLNAGFGRAFRLTPADLRTPAAD